MAGPILLLLLPRRRPTRQCCDLTLWVLAVEQPLHPQWLQRCCGRGRLGTTWLLLMMMGWLLLQLLL